MFIGASVAAQTVAVTTPVRLLPLTCYYYAPRHCCPVPAVLVLLVVPRAPPHPTLVPKSYTLHLPPYPFLSWHCYYSGGCHHSPGTVIRRQHITQTQIAARTDRRHTPLHGPISPPCVTELDHDCLGPRCEPVMLCTASACPPLTLWKRRLSWKRWRQPPFSICGLIRSALGQGGHCPPQRLSAMLFIHIMNKRVTQRMDWMVVGQWGNRGPPPASP